MVAMEVEGGKIDVVVKSQTKTHKKYSALRNAVNKSVFFKSYIYFSDYILFFLKTRKFRLIGGRYTEKKNGDGLSYVLRVLEDERTILLFVFRYFQCYSLPKIICQENNNAEKAVKRRMIIVVTYTT